MDRDDVVAVLPPRPDRARKKLQLSRPARLRDRRLEKALCLGVVHYALAERGQDSGLRSIDCVHGLHRDSRSSRDLCERDNEVTEVALTSEAEGAGLVLGAALGGERAALLMQSSGVGNCINTFSILKNCAISCVLVVSMRGEFADFNPWQVPMGSITEPVLKLCGFQCYRIDNEADVESIAEAACRMAFGGGNMQVAILLSQRMVDRTKPKGH